MEYVELTMDITVRATHCHCVCEGPLVDMNMVESIAAMEPTVYERALNLELVFSVDLDHRTILRLATTLACWKKWVRSYSRYVC